MNIRIAILSVLFFFAVGSVSNFPLFGQTYYYDGGSISMKDLRNARPYKKGTFLLQGSKRGIIWIPKYDARGNRYLELMLEHFLQGYKEIQDYSGVQVGSIVGGSHGIASVLALLMDLDARELLGVGKEQGEKINEIVVDFRKQLNKRMTELRQNNPRASVVEIALMRTGEIERLSFALQTRLESILSEKQIQQAKEIVFQLYNGFETPVVDLGILSLFNLSKEQREKLELIAEDANEKRNKVFQEQAMAHYGAKELQATDSALRNVSILISQKVRDVLNKEQLKLGDDLMVQADKIKSRLGLTEE